MLLDRAKKLTALGVVQGEEDRQSLQGILARSTWVLQLASTFQQAQYALHDRAIGVIVTDPDLPGAYSWRHTAQFATQIAPPPAVIVASRWGDDRLWAAVLNLGGFDLIWKPFDAIERARMEGILQSAKG
jgi:DNA-binding response OmpR family regulator